jgi:hypothetical protein
LQENAAVRRKCGANDWHFEPKQGLRRPNCTRPSLRAIAAEQAEDWIMPDWILGPVCAILLVDFIFYAFRQGFSVKPDRSKSGFGPTTDDQWLGSSRRNE